MMRSLFQRVFPGNPLEEPARALYESIVHQARCPQFYSVCGVPDSTDGRFEMLLLHTALIMRRLRQEGETAAGLRQTLFDTLIFDMDQSLRQSGVGDLKVGPKLKRMGEAFYGRSKAYDDGLDSSDATDLREALVRNVYGTTAAPSDAALDALAYYMRESDGLLAQQDRAALLKGQPGFAAPPAPEAVSQQALTS
ncbi:ubiquinol-cytochrome C chaperone family protein [Aquibaculum arenosum]|uniref:Ubiquinol-cytochrome C chaperone family protein n=1 Tax=Aquibaculum arenosum TaxID=3032591 RepID=A0ABT5YPW8_9PROT|nr:ubiquinol-cytochrome C chaperone family protein [Fodinicurvata sp. CAU 1616]MDF2096234.1 ubiquinol-cytochrome C chaperone family protein [Fodinicurvata sp. CAU 1616]